MRTDILSTSSIGASPALCLAFGPTSENGLGIGYTIRPDFMTFTITAKAHMEREWQAFAHALEELLKETAALAEDDL